VPGKVGSGAIFQGSGKVVRFPAAEGSKQNIELDRGEVEFWYRPSYDAGADDVIHALVVVGDVYNPPHLKVEEGDRLSLTLVDADFDRFTAVAEYHAPLWTAGQWVQIRAAWDNTRSADLMQIYVDGRRVDAGGVTEGWDLGSENDIGDIFIGASGAEEGFSASGVIDDLVIYAQPQPAPPPLAVPTYTISSLPPSPTAAVPQNTSISAQTASTRAPITASQDTPVATNAPPSGAGVNDPGRVVNPARLPLQPVGRTFTDPAFGTTLRRVSDTSGSGSFETQIYSQLQAFSADNEYLLLTGATGYIVRRVSDLSLVQGLETAGWNVPRWHPARPHILVHFDSNEDTTIRLQFTDVDTLETTTLFAFPPQYQRIRGNQSFDELSDDGKWLAGMVAQEDGTQVLFSFDLEGGKLGALLPLPDLYTGACRPDPQYGQVEPDWVGVSPLGRYLVVQWARGGPVRCGGLETFDIETGQFVGRVYDGHQHGDLGLSADGRTETFMTFEIGHPSGFPALGVRELPGTSTVSEPRFVQVIDWHGSHISCRGPAGVCLVTTTQNLDNGYGPFEGELFLQYSDGRVLRLAHHRSSSCGYWVQPRATISRDGRYVVFASDWGQETGQSSCGGGNDLGAGDPYIIDLGQR
jgi:hypothetical protein